MESRLGRTTCGLTKKDADILRFLAAAEIIETDAWQQYNELAGIQDREVPGGSGNPAYTEAVKVLDEDTTATMPSIDRQILRQEKKRAGSLEMVVRPDLSASSRDASVTNERRPGFKLQDPHKTGCLSRLLARIPVKRAPSTDCMVTGSPHFAGRSSGEPDCLIRRN
jgi:hypothetical protein